MLRAFVQLLELSRIQRTVNQSVYYYYYYYYYYINRTKRIHYKQRTNCIEK